MLWRNRLILFLCGMGLVLGLLLVRISHPSTAGRSGLAAPAISAPAEMPAVDPVGKKIASPGENPPMKIGSAASRDPGSSSRDRFLENLGKRRTNGELPEIDEETSRLVEQALTAPEAEERSDALAAIGLLDPSPTLRQVCLEALQDPDPEVREEAVLALDMLDATEAIPLLQVLEKEDPSEDVRASAREALEALTRPPG